MKLCSLFSGGKDSTYAAWLMSKQHEISCLLTLKSENTESYMFHTANINLTEIQAKLMNIPIEYVFTKGIKEEELADIENGLRKMKAKYGIQGITTGAVASNYQRSRIEDICKKLELECFSPFWGKNPEEVLTEMINSGFEIMIVAVGAEGLGKEWLGRKIDSQALEELKSLHTKHGIHVMGEGGEYETFVTDCPMFSKKITVMESEKNWDNSTRSGELAIKKLNLESKDRE